MNADAERDFVSFVEARSHSLSRMALALTADRQQAEDLLQSVLARAYRRWSRIEGNPETCLRAAMYRQRVTWWRRTLRGREVSTADLPERPDSRDAPAQVDLSLALRAALRRLAPGYRAVLVLRYLEDLHDHEIAAILGCQPSTVRSQATRALGQLRAICRSEGLGADPSPSTTLAQEAHL